MKIFDMPRGTGKTYQLAMLSEKTGYPVLVANEMEREDCERRFPKAKFISVSGWQWTNKEERPKHIYVDEAFWVLQKLLSYDVEIEGVSFSSEQEAYAQYWKWDREKDKDYYL